MRRWNGWGDEKVVYPLPPSATRYLTDWIGPSNLFPDASLESVLSTIPPSRLPEHPLIKLNPEDRLHHARGQSLPDWVALRSGQIGAFPDGVAYPSHEDEIRQLLSFAQQTNIRIIPFGGGTSVVGHINPIVDHIPVLTIDLSRLNKMIALDETSQLATFEAGVSGPELEAQLHSRGYTLGHYPQSFEYSTLGGWIATRSCGQQSYYYGRIEDLFAGGRVETPLGALDIPAFSASAAGPDLRHLVLGSEGRLGLITHATIRIRPLPEIETFYGVFFRDWEAGVAAMREIAQEKVPISMARLSDAQETQTTLVLSGKERLVSLAERGLNVLKYGSERCLLVFGVTGNLKMAKIGRRLALDIIREHGGLFTGALIGNIWRKSRFLTPYLRNTLWEYGYAIDTLETVFPWNEVLTLSQEIKKTIRDSMTPFGESALVFAHLSHIYRDGASIYITYLFRRSPDPQQTLQRWQTMKGAASQFIVLHGGTISHQHGVGIDHAPYLEAEKGKLGLALLQQTARFLDPQNLMNPGKLF